MSYGKIYFIYYKVIRRSMKFLFSPAPLSRFNFLDTFFTSLSLISGCERKGSDNACVRACARVASNYPLAKLMEIAESVHTGRVRATGDKILNFYNFTRAL